MVTNSGDCERTWSEREEVRLAAKVVTSDRGLANETENQGFWNPTEEDEACSWSWDHRALQQHSQGSV